MKNRKESSIPSTTKEVLPFKQYKEQLHCYEMKSAIYPYVELLKIIPRDRTAMSKEDADYECFMWQRFYLTYTDDIKLIASNFSVDTTKQCEYYLKKIGKTKNPVFKKHLARELSIFQNIAIKKKNREFVMMVFAENEKKMNENLSAIDNYLGIGENGRILYMSRSDKDNFWHLYSNKSLMIGGK